MIIIGIDPGINGAMAAVDSHGTCAIDDLPSVAMPGSGRTQRKIDGKALADLLRRHIPAGEAGLVVMEDVHAMPSSKSGSGANTSLMHTKGMIEGVLGALRFELVLVNSRKWKGFYGLYPSAEHMLRRVKDHNRAESLLIAHWGLRSLA
jgi:hypothetical protein